MSNYSSIKATIDANIKANDNQEITGVILNSVLNEMIDSLAAGFLFKGIAVSSTNPGTPDENVFYIGGGGTYSNFSGLTIPADHLGVLKYNGSWSVQSVAVGKNYDSVIATIQAAIATDGEDIDSLQSAVSYLQWVTEALSYSSAVSPSMPGETSGVQISEGKWVSQTPRRIYLLSYTYQFGDRMRLKANATQTAYYAFLTSSTHTVGSDVPFCIAGQTEWASVPSNTEIEVDIPSNCTCIAINKSYQGNPVVVFEPQSIEIITPHRREVDHIPELGSENLITSDAVAQINEVIGGEPTSVTAEWNDAQLHTSTPSRVFYICKAKTVKNGIITVKLNDYTNYKMGIVIQDGVAYTSETITDTGWKQQDISKVISASEAGYNIRVTIAKVNNTNISIQDATGVLSELSYVYTEGEGGLIDRIEDLEEFASNPLSPIPVVSLGDTLNYVGRKIDVSSHSYSKETLGSLTTVTPSRQGAAVYGDYLFQCHDTNSVIVIFKLSTGANIQTINLTANVNNHANSASFGWQKYDVADPLPCLYVSSEAESKVYVYRVTGTEGSFSLSLVQTLSYALPYYYANLHIDAPNNRGVIVGYKENSYSSPVGNRMMCCCFDLPEVTAGDKTLDGASNEFSFPFLYAAQGAVARYGKLYAAFGNTNTGLNIAGIIVVDYTLRNVESFLDLQGVGNLEPEGIGLYDEGMVITTQAGAVIKLTF